MESLRLTNVRSLVDTGSVRIAPITLLLGQNSSGKSTFARFFPLLRQTSESLTREPLLWLGRLVDFGSAEETRSRFAAHDSIGAEYQFLVARQALARRRRNYFIRTGEFARTADADWTRVKVRVSYEPNETGKRSYCLKINCFDHVIDLRVLPNGSVENVTVNGRDLSSVCAGDLSANTWTACFPSLSVKDGGSLPDEIRAITRQLSSFVRIHTHGKSGTGRVESLTRALLYAPLDRLIDAVKTNGEADSIWQRTTGAWSESTSDFMLVRDLIVAARIPEITSTLSLAFMGTVRQIRYITPVRASAERYYRQQGLAVGEIDPQGQNVAMFLHNMSPIEQTNFSDWMLGAFGYYFETQSSQGHVSIVIRDAKVAKTQHAFNLADTGFGFSQMLPVLIQIWTLLRKESLSGLSQNTRVIAIEQPELHLHPRLQAKLADVLLAAVNSAREANIDLRLVMETHSEQIVNRIGKRVAENKFDGADTNVVLFEKTGFTSPTSVTQTSYDKQGLLNNWPYGFFDSDNE